MLKFNKHFPVPALAQFVQSYYVARHRAEPEITPDFLPNNPQGTIDLMFVLDGGMHISTQKEEELYLEKICLMAQQEGNFQVRFTPRATVFGIAFFPESFGHFFQLPLSEVTNSGLNITEEVLAPYRELREKLAELISDQDRILLMDRFLFNQLEKRSAEQDQLEKLIAYIRTSGGKKSIQELADLSGQSARSLQRKVKNRIGVSPKTYSGIVRFNHVLSLLQAGNQQDWQDILYFNGYYDQSHFIKDFRHYTGKTPSEFLGGDKGLSRHFLDL